MKIYLKNVILLSILVNIYFVHPLISENAELKYKLINQNSDYEQ